MPLSRPTRFSPAARTTACSGKDSQSVVSVPMLVLMVGPHGVEESEPTTMRSPRLASRRIIRRSYDILSTCSSILFVWAFDTDDVQ